ncbi:hypothetical protein SNL152K_4845 [Streptomyces sp. NL15-2K]|nr:hypothetical protein SNL152K_4845 [Streptomyces sp. NL15-2K]
MHLDPATTAVIRGVVPMDRLRDFFDASFRTLALTIDAQRIVVASPAFCIHHGLPGHGHPEHGLPGHGLPGENLDLEVGFATDRAVRPQGDVVAGSLPGGLVARLTHIGPYDALGASWERLHSWLRAQGLSAGENRWETYVTRPTPEMDPRELRTELNWPVAH